MMDGTLMMIEVKPELDLDLEYEEVDEDQFESFVQCQLCQAWCQDTDTLQAHVTFAHRTADEKVAATQSSDSGCSSDAAELTDGISERLLCSICCDSFNSNAELSSHLAEGTCTKPVMCRRCHGVFQTAMELDSHACQPLSPPSEVEFNGVKIKEEQDELEEPLNLADKAVEIKQELDELIAEVKQDSVELESNHGVSKVDIDGLESQSSVCPNLGKSTQDVSKSNSATVGRVDGTSLESVDANVSARSCNTCGSRLVSEDEIGLHSRKATCEGDIACNQCSQVICECPKHCLCPCGARFGNEMAVWKHLKACEVATNLYGLPYCNVCHKNFKSKKEKEDHTCGRDNSTHCCQFCPQRFETAEELKSHSVNHSFKCHECHKTYSSKGRLSRHFLVHLRKTYRCQKCPKDFRSQSQLEIHEWFHERDKKGKVVVSEKKKEELMTPVASLIVANMKKIAPNPNPSGIPVIYTTSSSSSILQYAIQPKLVPLAPAPSTECLKEQRQNFKAYKRFIKSFKCDFCPKTFYQRCQMVNHRRVHTGEKPFECRFCGKKFPWKSSAIIHERLHKNENPFSCKCCGRYFEDKDALQTHHETCPRLAR